MSSHSLNQNSQSTAPLIFLTGGGTAGHVTPNIALIETLSLAHWQIEYVGSHGGIEKSMIEPLGVVFHGISSGKLRRYFSWQNFVDPIFIFWGILQSLYLCLYRRPKVVFSKGGFVAVPLVFAAWLCRIPVICHESDITPGLANKLSFPFARHVCLNFSQTKKYLPSGKLVVTGTPVRRSIIDGDASKGLAFLGFDKSREVILVFGGSLGAEAINACVYTLVPELADKYQIVHIVGKNNLDNQYANISGYRQFEFLQEEFGDVLAAADAVVSRAGANSIYELLVMRKPHILIPLSSLASRGDQIINAEIFEKEGMSMVIKEESLSEDLLGSSLEKLISNKAFYQNKLREFETPDALSVIADLISNAAK
ncbi:MAG: UDP-N-acetylglucosamine--N-acetylmuramyl-(pentapeptide) pyrophosphoryl-undecaprenol N-acetylglucosamine transferase [Candidatus Azotimanducaceae bacterium]|jgi:UDP-N-acetylglucosamine--N-acetylmuramyl-(pentapeptide) pyrophosphoryl-undecaprenol N-acetylglucosamine transferase